MCVAEALAVGNCACESRLCKFGEGLHQGLEEGEVVGPCGGVDVWVADFSSSPGSLDLGSCGGERLGQAAWCLGEGDAGVAEGDGHEFYLSPNVLEGGDERGVLSGLLLNCIVATEVPTKADLDEDEVALLALESTWVRRRGVRYSSGVDEVGGGSMSLPVMASWIS